MSEENNDQIIDGEYTEKEIHQNEPVNAPKQKKHRKGGGKGGIIALAIVCGLAAGFGGGAIATGVFGSSGTTVVYKTAEDSSSTTQTTSSSSDGDLSTTEIAAKASPSVVEINVTGIQTSYGMFGGTYETEAVGSGVIISTDGYIITNNHVVEDGTDYKVVTSDGTEYSATLVAADSKSDIAVLKIEADGLTPATIGDSDKIAVGDKAVVIGNPLGTLGGTVTDGIISATNRQITINNESMTLIQTNAAINSGNSGGGLFDGQGDLIGIVNAKDSGTTSSGTTIEGLGFAIPINQAMDVAEQLIENGKVTDRASLGVYVQELTYDTGNYSAGVYITSLVSGGGAEKAGLQVYDRIVKVDDTEITSYTDLSSVISSKEIGDTVSVTYERNGKQDTVTVTLGSSADE
jgi:serine protease Do